MEIKTTETNEHLLEYRLTMGMTVMEGQGFYYPVDTSIAPNGRMYVISRSRDEVARGVRITMCTVEGEYFGNFGGFGQDDGQFVWPCCSALDSFGRFYVTDEELHRILIFDSSGKFLNGWGKHGSADGELDTPSGIAFDSHDNLYVSDTYNNRIQKFTSDGYFLMNFSSHGNHSISLPWGLTADIHDNIYVADWGNDTIRKFSPDGLLLASFGTSGNNDGEFCRPSSVAVDNDGYIYVADWGNERVQVLDTDGEFIEKLRGNGTISKWAQNFLNINVEEASARDKADLNLQIDYVDDSPHEESSHIEKYFWSPTSVTLDANGCLYVTETNRHRIQVYAKRNR